MSVEQPRIDEVGQVEVLGYDHIPESQRHGTPRELAGVWAAAYIAPLYLLLGGLLMTLGLNLWQAVLALVLGNLTYVLVAMAGTAGPKAGTPTITISRAQYGPRGNQVSAFLAWFNLVAFEAVNFTVGATALNLLLESAGLKVSTPVRAITLGLVIVGTFVLAYYGHATIVRFQQWAAVALGVGAVLLFVFVLDDVTWNYQSSTPLTGFAGVATWFVALGIIVSGAISWCTVPADYTRYLPATSRPRSIVLWTTLGGVVPAVLLGLVAVLAGTAADMADPFAGIKQVVPGWFYIPILLLLLVGSVSNNVLTIYSSSMSLQTMGVPIKRYQGVFIDGVIGTAMALYATFVTDFLTALTEFLQIAVIWYATYLAIFLADQFLRNNRYDGVELHRREGGRYWYRNGVHWPGMIALVAGVVVGLLFASTTRYTGPLSRAMSGMDLAWVVSFVVGGGVYYTLARRTATVGAHLARSQRPPAAPPGPLAQPQAGGVTP